jgi:ABC-type transporter MlaC component
MVIKNIEEEIAKIRLKNERLYEKIKSKTLSYADEHWYMKLIITNNYKIKKLQNDQQKKPGSGK